MTAPARNTVIRKRPLRPAGVSGHRWAGGTLYGRTIPIHYHDTRPQQPGGPAQPHLPPSKPTSASILRCIYMFVNCHTVHVDGTEKHERAMRGNPYHTDHTITPPPHNLLKIKKQSPVSQFSLTPTELINVWFLG